MSGWECSGNRCHQNCLTGNPLTRCTLNCRKAQLYKWFLYKLNLVSDLNPPEPYVVSAGFLTRKTIFIDTDGTPAGEIPRQILIEVVAGHPGNGEAAIFLRRILIKVVAGRTGDGEAAIFPRRILIKVVAGHPGNGEAAIFPRRDNAKSEKTPIMTGSLF